MVLATRGGATTAYRMVFKVNLAEFLVRQFILLSWMVTPKYIILIFIAHCFRFLHIQWIMDNVEPTLPTYDGIQSYLELKIFLTYTVVVCNALPNQEGILKLTPARKIDHP